MAEDKKYKITEEKKYEITGLEEENHRYQANLGIKLKDMLDLEREYWRRKPITNDYVIFNYIGDKIPKEHREKVLPAHKQVLAVKIEKECGLVRFEDIQAEIKEERLTDKARTANIDVNGTIYQGKYLGVCTGIKHYLKAVVGDKTFKESI